MKRYRVIQSDLDTRATILKQVIAPEWELQVRAQWEANQASIRDGLIHEFAAQRYAIKLQNFRDLDAAPISVLAFHNRFLRQARSAFVVESYYPALTGACALGERILNHLIIALREDFRATPEYKAVHRKQSFDNWPLAIRALGAWGVLAPGVDALFAHLEGRRHSAVHFSPELDRADRAPSLEAIRLISEIISRQFGAFGILP
jgi:hypothetical protein